MKDEPTLSSAVLLTELNDKLDRMASAAAQGSLHMARAVRIIDASHQLDARERMALRDEVVTLRRINMNLERAVAYLQNRPASMTVVQDVPAKRDDEITTTVMLGQPWWGVTIGGKRIPSRWVARIVVVLMVASAVMLVFLGMWLKGAGVTPQQVVKAAAPLVAP